MRWLALGHGTGGGIEAPDLVVLAERLPEHGVGVALYEQPWRVAGRRVAPRPAVLDEGWLPAIEALRGRLGEIDLTVGGRSAGARVACRTAAAVAASHVLTLAFPLHPPGRPDRSRIDELAQVQVPCLALQGERDPFGSDEEVRAALQGAGAGTGHRVVAVAGAAHDLRVPKRHPEHEGAWDRLWGAVIDWLGE
ncbi:alpha/beta hydrolase family protein [Aestuariimicrobium ganziense]|uniref:alpha/beta hydrolase family protein n=1 Tax=Aestuariimicrobium ganziense TaxID=2773677 RepID=UPI001F354040|nr:alpha/beta family hydrolase [Aestuariimicrobium ganziense]